MGFDLYWGSFSCETVHWGLTFSSQDVLTLDGLQNTAGVQLQNLRSLHRPQNSRTPELVFVNLMLIVLLLWDRDPEAGTWRPSSVSVSDQEPPQQLMFADLLS